MMAQGFAFVEIAAPSSEDENYLALFLNRLGFSCIGRHRHYDIRVYQQASCYILMNCERKGRGAGREGAFVRSHGICASACGLYVKDALSWSASAFANGAMPYKYALPYRAPAVMAIGDTLIYGIDQPIAVFLEQHFDCDSSVSNQPGNPSLLTSLVALNFVVYAGHLPEYRRLLCGAMGFSEVNHYAGPTLSVVNLNYEATCYVRLIATDIAHTSCQAAQFLKSHMGEGVQAVSFTADNLTTCMANFKKRSIAIEPQNPHYYDRLSKYFSGMNVNLFDLSKHHIMVDGLLKETRGSAVTQHILHAFLAKTRGHVRFEVMQSQDSLMALGNFSSYYQHHGKAPSLLAV